MRYTIAMLLLAITFTGWGQQHVDFRLRDLDNKEQTFAELKGENLTVIDFWATWCRPCLRAIPELNGIYDVYRDKGGQHNRDQLRRPTLCIKSDPP